jgi:phosphate:Na+ symporter
MSFLEVLAQISAGLGLFFMGLKTLTGGMQQQATYGVRRLIQKATRNPALAAGIGMLAGFLLQKPSAVISIMAGMLSSGLLGLRQALPIVAWCNIGLAFLAFFLVFDIRLAVFFTVGVSGFLLAFVRNKRHLTALTILFGAALLLYGLGVMKGGASEISKFPWMASVLDQARGSYLLALGVGAFVAAITQSFIGVAILCITLVNARVLDAQQAMMMIYGANFGVGFFRRVMTATLTGEGKQLFLFQNIFRYGGTIASVALFYAVRIHGEPIVLLVVRRLADGLDAQMALVLLTCNLPAVVLTLLFREPIIRWLQRKSPASLLDEMARLKHLTGADVGNLPDALARLDREQADLSRTFVEYTRGLRGEGKAMPPDALHQAVRLVLEKIADFEALLARRAPGVDGLQRLSALANRRTLLGLVDDALHQMAGAAHSKAGPGTPLHTSCVLPLAESLEAVLLTLHDALEDPAQADSLLALTGDRAALMARYRARVLQERALDPAREHVVMTLTNLFEQVIWMIRRLAISLAPPPSTDTK